MTKLSIQVPSYGEPRSLEQVIKKQLQDFFKKNAGIAEADIKLTYGADHGSHKICQIYLKTTQKNIFTIQKSSSFETSTTKAIKKLQEQLQILNTSL